MIKKILKIKKLAVFNDFDWDKSVLSEDNKALNFKKINIIYGRNYSGKTTLSRILRSLETGKLPDRYDSPEFTVLLSDGSEITDKNLSDCTKNIRVFNKDFVKENLRFIYNQDETIEPFAVLGEKNVEIETEILEIEDVIGSDIEGKESGLYLKQKHKEDILQKLKKIDEKHTKNIEDLLYQEANHSKTGIRNNPNKYGDQNYNISKLKTEIETILLPTYIPLTKEKKQEYEKTIVEEEKVVIPSVLAPELAFDRHCKIAQELLLRSISDTNKISELISEAALNEWVKNGMSLHEGKRNTCAFCNNEISKKRWNDLHAHFDQESKILERDIDKAIEEIEKEKETIEMFFMEDKDGFYTKYQSKAEELKEKFNSAATDYNEQLDMIISQLKSRKEKITVSTSFNRPENKVNIITEIIDQYAELISVSNNFSNQLIKEKNAIREKLRLQEVYEFCERINYTNLREEEGNAKKETAEAQEEVDRIKAEILEKEAEKEEKIRQLSNEVNAAKMITCFLRKSFGHNSLSLKAVIPKDESPKNARFKVLRDGKCAYNLSEGECGLIAFCYFMATLKSSDRKSTKIIIWIDDPVCSLDANHIFFVYSLLVSEVIKSENLEQLFISTHNLDFLRYMVRYLYKYKKDHKQYFLISREEKFSTLKKMPKYLEEYATEFNYLFSCIYKCATATVVDDSNYELFCNFANNARKFLEIYLYFKYPDFSGYRERVQRFWGDETIPSIITTQIQNEYSHLKGIERACMPIEVPEMHTAAKQIIEKIKKEDLEQYNALVRSIDKA